ncbi:MAG: DivIVA domain-containing protein [Actinobacteria bacterium]|nr:DivIVA domain-containing protein [Actinomycetota bacterium]
MSLTPDEIATKEFLVGLRGYDKEEVRTFLRTVSVAFANVQQEAADAAAAEPAPEPEPTPEPVAAPEPEPAPRGDAGKDWAELGEEIAAVLRTAHEQAGGLRADAEASAAATRQQAEADAASIRAQAAAEAEAVKAAAEQDRTEAAGKLAAAQAEALGLVADAQARVDHLIETSRQRAHDEATASVAHLTAQTATLSEAREHLKTQLGELRTRLDKALNTVGD